VGWFTTEGQTRRFELQARVLSNEPADGAITINDLGCGYGSFFKHVRELPCFAGGAYYGYDICEEMIMRATRDISDTRAHFEQSLVPTRRADYSFASGTFTIRLDTPKEVWEAYIRKSLKILAAATYKGFAFNILSSEVDEEPDIYRAEPGPYLDFIRGEISNDVTLIEGYSLAEWTVLVKV